MKADASTKVLLYYPEWGNRWAPYIEKELSRYDLFVANIPSNVKVDLDELGKMSEQADVLISMWCDGVAGFWAAEFPHKKIISYLRRYEIWEDVIMNGVKFGNIDAMIFVSEYYRDRFLKMTSGKPQPPKTYVIPNGIDLADFPFREREPGYNIAMVCTLKNVKNFPLAALILNELPEEYKIYHIGIPFASQIAGQVVSYIHNLGLGKRFIFEGQVQRDDVPKWLNDKDFILSTSINEGNPNNVIEAMAMGIKPVIHNWPGAKEQFAPWVFDTVKEAVEMFEYPGMHEEYGDDVFVINRYYRNWVEERFSINNFKALHKVIEEL